MREKSLYSVTGRYSIFTALRRKVTPIEFLINEISIAVTKWQITTNLDSTHLAAATPIDPVSRREWESESSDSARVNGTRDSSRRQIRWSRETFLATRMYAMIEQGAVIAAHGPFSCHRRVSRHRNSEDDTPLPPLSPSPARMEFVRRRDRRRRRSIFGRARRMPPAIWLRLCARDINRPVNAGSRDVVSRDSLFSR